MDDILAYTKDHDEHLQMLEESFRRLRGYNLKLSMEKSTFDTNATQYLGF